MICSVGTRSTWDPKKSLVAWESFGISRKLHWRSLGAHLVRVGAQRTEECDARGGAGLGKGSRWGHGSGTWSNAALVVGL